MSEHPNETVVRRFYAGFSSGDMEELGRIMADDILWSNPGDSQISGVRKGRDAVFELFQTCGQLTAGRLAVELETLKVEPDGTVVSTHRVTAERDGYGKLDLRETEHVTIEDGRITRVEESYADQATSDAFWA